MDALAFLVRRYSLLSTNAHASQEAFHEFTYAHPRCESLVVSPRTVGQLAGMLLLVSSREEALSGLDRLKWWWGKFWQHQDLTTVIATARSLSTVKNFGASFIVPFQADFFVSKVSW